MNPKSSSEIVSFDEFGIFEIKDQQLTDLVTGGAVVPSSAAMIDTFCVDANGACHNKQCINGYCSQNGNCVEVDNAGCINPNPDVDVMCAG